MVLSLFKDAEKTRIFILEVIEWTDDKEEFLNGEMTSKVEEGLRMLSAVIYTKKGSFQRIVKIYDPSSKIVDLAKKLEIDLITMGSTWIGVLIMISDTLPERC